MNKDIGRSPASQGQATGLRPQPAAPSSQSGALNACRPYDAAKDGFDNARFVMALTRIADVAVRRSADLAYGAWNPRFCSADAAREALRFFRDLIKLIDRHADEAASAMSAGAAETPQEAQGQRPASAAPEGGDAQPSPSQPIEGR